MKKLALLALPAVCLIPACAIPGDAAWSDLHANGYGSLYNLNASGAVNDVSVSSAPIAISGDLSIKENSDTNFLGGARVGFAPMEVSMSMFSHKSIHNGAFVGNFDLGTGTSFTGTSDADTTLDFEVTKLMLGFDMMNTGLFRIGILFGVDMVTFNDFSVTASQAGKSLTYAIATDEEIPIPMVGVRGDLLLPEGFRVGAEVSGVSADIDDIDGTFLDIDAQIGWTPMDNEWIEVLIGYRMMSFDFKGELDGTSVDAEVDFDGFYWGVGITF
ncbi:MAG: hypothetical protein HQ519_02945 [Planctomycetes bacterium]|nr:hypothetical protein [Planctomycetota bacterium]